MKIIAGTILCLINVIGPMPVVTFARFLLSILRVEELAEALRELNELERLERRAKKLEGDSPEAAQSAFLLEIQLEIVAARFSIKRLTALLRRAEYEHERIAYRENREAELVDYYQLVERHRKIAAIDPTTTKLTLADILRSNIENVETRFEAAFEQYVA